MKICKQSSLITAVGLVYTIALTSAEFNNDRDHSYIRSSRLVPAPRIQQRNDLTVVSDHFLRSLDAVSSSSDAKAKDYLNVTEHHWSDMQRRLTNTREEYVARLSLHLENDSLVPENKIQTLTEEAKYFITRNIASSSSSMSDGIVAIGILSVILIDQVLDDSFTPTLLFVELDVKGVVLAKNPSDLETLNFTRAAEAAITARDNQFLRKIEPLLFPPSDDVISGDGIDKDGAADDSKNSLMMVIVSVSLVFSMVVILIAVRGWQTWRRFATPNENKKELADENASAETSSEDVVEDSIDEESMYTNTCRDAGPSIPTPTKLKPSEVSILDSIS
jgi:hypothetical protein